MKKETDKIRVPGLSFGDVYLIEEIIRRTGFNTVLDAVDFENRDSLYCGILYYVIPSRSRRASDWWSMSYASILYPHAQMDPQGFDQMLRDLGKEDVRKRFLGEYFKFYQNYQPSKSRGILMMSREPSYIALSARNGLPLFYRPVPGNVSNAAAFEETINELKAAGIPFITRVGADRKIFKEALQKYRSTIMSLENAFIYRKRLYYIVETKVREDYGYLCLDEEESVRQQNAVLRSVDYNGDADEETRKALENCGVFVFLSSAPVNTEELLDICFAPDLPGKDRGIDNRDANGETFPGHLLLSFISAVIRRLLLDAFRETGCTPEDVLLCAHDLQCLVYGDEVWVNKAPKQVARLFRAVNIHLPDKCTGN